MFIALGTVSIRYELIGDMLKTIWYANGVKIGVTYLVLNEYAAEHLKDEIGTARVKGELN